MSLAEDAFMRTLPFTVDYATRLRTDALVFSADTVSSSYYNLLNWAISSAYAVKSGSDEGISIIALQLAWSIVDQIHNARLLLRDLLLEMDEVDIFIKQYDHARLLRNRMDHLAGSINNISKSKGSNQSLFGNLSYIVSVYDDDQKGLRTYFVFHQTGAVQPGQVYGDFEVPAGVRMPVGNFQLSAAGFKINIDTAVEEFMALMRLLNTTIEERVMQQVRTKAIELGRPESDFMAHYGASITFRLALEGVTTAADIEKAIKL